MGNSPNPTCRPFRDMAVARADWLARLVPSATTMSGAPIGVLVVDDEPLMRWALTEVFRGRGCEVVQAGDARTALHVMGERVARPFDVVVLDYHLPDAHDLDLLATTRRMWPDSTVIVLTALMAPEEVARALALGASHVVQKPIEMETFATLALGVVGEDATDAGSTDETPQRARRARARV